MNAVRRLVTIDGASGSGKTTLGRELARRLGVPLIDTGLFFRGITAGAVQHGLTVSDTDGLVDFAQHAHIEPNVDPFADATQWQVKVNDIDVTEDIRNPKNTVLLSVVSGIPEVRTALLAAQRNLAVSGAVAVGRDCGTVIFPDAAVKIYLEASEAVRIQRRAEQMGNGAARDTAIAHSDVKERDRRDAQGPATPLNPASDAHVIDTTTFGIDAMVEQAVQLCADAGLLTTSPE